MHRDPSKWTDRPVSEAAPTDVRAVSWIACVFGLIVVAAALGLSNFAAAIGIGLSGIDGRLRVRVALVFGLFEATMPVVGLVVGHRLAASVGSSGSSLGGGLLIATGGYTAVQARRHRPVPVRGVARLGRLIVTGAALSVDNLVVGFALGAYKVSIAVAAVVIAVVSVAMSLVGLELGERLGSVVEKGSEEIGAAVLVLVGVAIALRLI